MLVLGGGEGESEGVYSWHAWPYAHNHRPSYPYNNGGDGICRAFTDQAAIAGTKREKRYTAVLLHTLLDASICEVRTKLPGNIL